MNDMYAFGVIKQNHQFTKYKPPPNIPTNYYIKSPNSKRCPIINFSSPHDPVEQRRCVFELFFSRKVFERSLQQHTCSTHLPPLGGREKEGGGVAWRGRRYNTLK